MDLARSSVIISPSQPAAGDGRRTVVWLRGEHDVATEAMLDQALATAIALDDGPLVVDLRGVQFMSASTVNAILRTQKVLRLQSRALIVRAPSSCAERVLDLCGLTGLLTRPHVARNREYVQSA